MSLLSGKILEIPITFSSKNNILEEARKYLLQQTEVRSQKTKKTVKPFVIVTPNPEQIVYARSHRRFAEILNQADVALPDGIGLVWASRLLSQNAKPGNRNPIPGRIPGVEFMEDLVALAAERSIRIGLIGGQGGVAVKALECLQKKHPRLEGWAEDGPELSVGNSENLIMPDTQTYMDRLAEKIRKTKTKMIFVGLGAPKQEYFIERLSREMSSFCHPELVSGSRGKTNGSRVKPGMTRGTIFMSVGGSFDILAGRLKRAPLLMRLIGFEWLWRLFQEPWRWRRQVALWKFVVLVLQERIRTS